MKNFIKISGLLMLILGCQVAEAQQNIAQQAYALFQQNCLRCHGEHGPFTEDIVIDSAAGLIRSGAVVPGKPIESELYTRLLEKRGRKRMPLGQDPLPIAAILTIGNWIQAGAPSWDVQHDVTFIPTDAMLTAIEKHLKTLDAFDRPSARYFTTTHLYNAGEGPETLRAAEVALSKLVNSLSWSFDIINPSPIDEQKTIFYIDLRDYEWDVREVWTQLEAAYPYTIGFDAEMHAGLHQKLMGLREEMKCEVPFVQADWFLAVASLPPLYHDILGLPETDRELERELGIDVARNLQRAPGSSVWRAGTNDSGVSENNRVVERHKSRYGAYWKSYDFAGSVGEQNIFTHPLSFKHDGGEIIFNLPNGLQAYYISDGLGNRIDVAPTEIVSNPAASDPAVRNGLSCIGCHTEGMKEFEDGVRAVIQETARPSYDKDQALRLYVEKTVMDALVKQDSERYEVAVEKTGGVSGGIEPVHLFHEAFQGPLDAPHAAAAIGMETDTFLEKIRQEPSLQNLGLTGLLSGGTVKRDVWTSNFGEIVAILSSPDSSVVKPVVPRTERIPGESVHIPDANLRAAIAEALGKALNASITVEEMATLIHFEAAKTDIQDLTGLQHAIHLETLKINGNPISDLSPLTKLINLKELNIDWTNVNDLSPLARLKKLQRLDVWNNESTIANLLPLANLTSLIHLNVSGSKELIDISPLANLTKLYSLRLYNNAIADITPLAELTDLTFLTMERNPVSDLIPLAKLTKLRFLSLANHATITDITPLAKLVALERLDLRGNRIKDVTPLANLRNLKWLALHLNDISDFSPIDGLRKNIEVLFWHDNPGFPKGGPKIESPWLWVTVPGETDHQGRTRLSDSDLLAVATNNRVTEQKIATEGAIEGTTVGNSIWTASELDAENSDNINTLLRDRGLNPPDPPPYVVYGTTTLYVPQKQDTMIFVGSNHDAKVWMNGQLIHNNSGHYQVTDYQTFAPVTLKQGRNVLLVAVDNHGGSRWAAYFGLSPGTEYTVSNPRILYTFSQDKIYAGDAFTLDISAENIYDLAGWQFDVTFDPILLAAVEVNEGDFLKTGGATTFFQKGIIDNTSGKITGLSAARLSEDGASGTGTLLFVSFKTKAEGKTQLVLRNSQLGDMTGTPITVAAPEVEIVIVGQLATGDVNRDGQVSILDMILIAQQLGKPVPPHSAVDVNGDGTISILDLILVAQHMGESTGPAAPSILAMNGIDGLDPAMVQTWIEEAQVEDDGSIAFQQGIAYLQSLLAVLIPEETMLLPNYPNPFNPETWIPYHLSEPADVRIRIYAASGVLVRTLALGHQPAGIYEYRSRAAYWDGKNAVGESVASGVYFYTFTAGDFTATRKMLIMK